MPPLARWRRTIARTAGSSTRCIATRTATWWPTRRRIAAELSDPDTLVFAYTPVEDPAIYEDIWAPFIQHLEEVTGKDVQFFAVQSNSAEVEAMRSGRLHIAGFSTGPTPFAVNLAGAVPFAIMGSDDGRFGYTLQVYTQADSDIQEMPDLAGKRVAHTSPTSNSGNLAPRALFPDLGVVPDEDYEVTYSGSHDQSMLGVVAGDYDAAPVASEVVDRMAERGLYDPEEVRIVWESEPFPTTSYTYAHDLAPELKDKIEEAFFSFDFAGTALGEEFAGVQQVHPDHLRGSVGGHPPDPEGERGRVHARRPGGRVTHRGPGRAPGPRAGDVHAKDHRPREALRQAAIPCSRTLSLTIEGESVVSIIGSSGAGKSTLLRCINRLVEPTSGSVVLNGTELTRLRGRHLREARRKIGMVFQSFNLVDRLTVMENVQSGPARLHLDLGRDHAPLSRARTSAAPTS